MYLYIAHLITFLTSFDTRQCNVGLRLLTVSYDVCCQWFTHFWTREKLLPPHLLLAFPNSGVQAKVPKFHLGSHVEACHAPFSLGYTLGVGRTDGEGVEHNWDGLNGQGPSTKEMGPGNRWDTLDDCCGHANWRKTVGLGE
jgi:Kyakuja-Dileera-Zisupton transposase